MQSLTLDEVRRLVVCIKEAGDNKGSQIEGIKRDLLLIQMGLSMGCRVSEICHLEKKNIHTDRIKIWDEKKDVYREVVIHEDVQQMLSTYILTEWKPMPHRRHQLFYFSEKTANRIIKHWFNVAGIPKEKAHWHVLRHTYVVQSLDAGIPLNYIVEQTGDTANTIISIYGKPSIDQRNEILKTKGAYWK